MSLELKHSQLFEFRPSALETFNLTHQGVYAKQLLIELTLSSLTRIRVAQPTP